MTMRIVIVTMSKSLYFNGNYNGNYYVTGGIKVRNISVYYYYYHHSTILSTLFKQQQPKISSEQRPPPFSPSSLFVRTKH